MGFDLLITCICDTKLVGLDLSKMSSTEGEDKNLKSETE